MRHLTLYFAAAPQRNSRVSRQMGQEGHGLARQAHGRPLPSPSGLGKPGVDHVRLLLSPDSSTSPWCKRCPWGCKSDKDRLATSCQGCFCVATGKHAPFRLFSNVITRKFVNLPAFFKSLKLETALSLSEPAFLFWKHHRNAQSPPSILHSALSSVPPPLKG